jgi:hypothetical protein
VSSAVQSPKAVPKVCEKEPTDYRHFEIYTFTNGTATRDGTSGEGGIDFNYGGAPNLQLTATVPAAYNIPSLGPSALNLGIRQIPVPDATGFRARCRHISQGIFAERVAGRG